MPDRARDKRTETASEGGAERLNELIGFHLRQASIFDLQGALSALAPTELRTVPVSVLMCIVEHPGLSAADTCRRLRIKRANIVPILSDLEKRGLIYRETDPGDQRIQHLFPTPEGAQTARTAFAALVAHEDRLLARLDPSERAMLRTLLTKIWQQS
ncbi:hypothetical protein DL1_10890 [Thioclava dalianensis]|uniref:HTH marR-type domain-containing protein n=1 Tax=Thioclava dalianensis TaxID=1185766 RepID=A0A074TQ61_9RHOB|nr:MarR family transcriptional regulator [Thioclava dalianensis]KEP71148.1 hypothetical protein DL1_10890 [Thioclava dalianensis]SFN23962.1 DNA-binding transcriptional regulator, MarR family [Thioclava dalianensis]